MAAVAVSPRAVGGVGAVGVALALSPLLEDPASRSFAWHMVQHQVLVLLAGPLVGLSLGEATSRRRPAPRAASLHVLVVGAGLAHVATLLLWHLPPAYDAATRQPALHGLEHATLLATAIVLWAGVWVARRGDRHPGTSLAVLVGTGLVSAGLGVVLLMAAEPLYAAYAGLPGALPDQRVGGALMKVGGLVVHAGAAVWLTVTWVSSLDRARSTTVGTPPVPGRR